MSRMNKSKRWRITGLNTAAFVSGAQPVYKSVSMQETLPKTGLLTKLMISHRSEPIKHPKWQTFLEAVVDSQFSPFSIGHIAVELPNQIVQ